MKVKLFTHTDLDGVGCAIVANHFFGAENVEVTYCDYKEVDDKIANFLNQGRLAEFDRMYITDISVKKEVADLIQSHYNHNVKLVDHHGTAVWLDEEYEWAMVSPIWPESNAKTSGTDLFLYYLASTTPHDTKTLFSLMDFAEKVRRWDTWDWFNVYKDEYAKQLNNLVYLVGRKRFADRFTSSLSLEFTEGETLLLELEEEKIKKYIDDTSKKIIRKKILGHDAGVVFAENYSSELGNALALQNPDLAFIVILNAKNRSVSYRGIRDDLDLGKDVAAVYGGGGHPKASGSTFDEMWLDQMIDKAFFDYR